MSDVYSMREHTWMKGKQIIIRCINLDILNVEKEMFVSWVSKWESKAPTVNTRERDKGSSKNITNSKVKLNSEHKFAMCMLIRNYDKCRRNGK